MMGLSTIILLGSFGVGLGLVSILFPHQVGSISQIFNPLGFSEREVVFHTRWVGVLIFVFAIGWMALSIFALSSHVG